MPRNSFQVFDLLIDLLVVDQIETRSSANVQCYVRALLPTKI